MDTWSISSQQLYAFGYMKESTERNTIKTEGTCWWTDIKYKIIGAVHHIVKAERQKLSRKNCAVKLKCEKPNKPNILLSLYIILLIENSCSKRETWLPVIPKNTERTYVFISNSHLWSQHGSDSQHHKRHENRELSFSGPHQKGRVGGEGRVWIAGNRGFVKG